MTREEISPIQPSLLSRRSPFRKTVVSMIFVYHICTFLLQSLFFTEHVDEHRPTIFRFQFSRYLQSGSHQTDHDQCQCSEYGRKCLRYSMFRATSSRCRVHQCQFQFHGRTNAIDPHLTSTLIISPRRISTATWWNRPIGSSFVTSAIPS